MLADKETIELAIADSNLMYSKIKMLGWGSIRLIFALYFRAACGVVSRVKSPPTSFFTSIVVEFHDYKYEEPIDHIPVLDLSTKDDSGKFSDMARDMLTLHDLCKDFKLPLHRTILGSLAMASRIRQLGAFCNHSKFATIPITEAIFAQGIEADKQIKIEDSLALNASN